jgi:hypothetical protein
MFQPALFQNTDLAQWTKRRGKGKAVPFPSDGRLLKPGGFLDTQNILIIFRVTSYGTANPLDDYKYFRRLTERR